MPLKRYLDEPGITPEAARAMTEAFATVTAKLKELGLGIPAATVAQKLLHLAHEGEADAASLAAAVLEAFLPKN
jgi:hypothetical protein